MYEQHSNNLSSAQMTLDSVNMDCQMMRDNMNIMQVMKNTVQVQKDTLHAMGGIDIWWYEGIKRWTISFK